MLKVYVQSKKSLAHFNIFRLYPFYTYKIQHQLCVLMLEDLLGAQIELISMRVYLELRLCFK